ncbi:uncharacterized protein LOC129233194 [Uloborus diversus]|uniref:uncharacterized protein LOC129233194 n=1 Tax=Uloborus diversus TaxID=327109 RepID=UPI002409876F|nr:uncharacterized protein LOC129233194 [Uloborus diversus]
MGLLVDMPKQISGTTNDGNTARRFFANPTLSSDITGLDIELIQRFSIILQAVSSEQEINEDEFEKFTFDTAKLYVQLYNWYFMPASVHKLLIHGRQIIEHAILPIGQLSEEAQEARNKDFKAFREYFSRKYSRQKTLEDIIHMLLITSDPLITKLRSNSKKHENLLSKEAALLLRNNQKINYSSSDSSSAEDDENFSY